LVFQLSGLAPELLIFSIHFLGASAKRLLTLIQTRLISVDPHQIGLVLDLAVFQSGAFVGEPAFSLFDACQPVLVFALELHHPRFKLTALCLDPLLLPCRFIPLCLQLRDLPCLSVQLHFARLELASRMSQRGLMSRQTVALPLVILEQLLSQSRQLPLDRSKLAFRLGNHMRLVLAFDLRAAAYPRFALGIERSRLIFKVPPLRFQVSRLLVEFLLARDSPRILSFRLQGRCNRLQNGLFRGGIGHSDADPKLDGSDGNSVAIGQHGSGNRLAIHQNG
jgi:hypothetical protein